MDKDDKTTSPRWRVKNKDSDISIDQTEVYYDVQNELPTSVKPQPTKNRKSKRDKIHKQDLEAKVKHWVANSSINDGQYSDSEEDEYQRIQDTRGVSGSLPDIKHPTYLPASTKLNHSTPELKLQSVEDHLSPKQEPVPSSSSSSSSSEIQLIKPRRIKVFRLKCRSPRLFRSPRPVRVKPSTQKYNKCINSSKIIVAKHKIMLDGKEVDREQATSPIIVSSPRLSGSSSSEENSDSDDEKVKEPEKKVEQKKSRHKHRHKHKKSKGEQAYSSERRRSSVTFGEMPKHVPTGIGRRVKPRFSTGEEDDIRAASPSPEKTKKEQKHTKRDKRSEVNSDDELPAGASPRLSTAGLIQIHEEKEDSTHSSSNTTNLTHLSEPVLEGLIKTISDKTESHHQNPDKSESDTIDVHDSDGVYSEYYEQLDDILVLNSAPQTGANKPDNIAEALPSQADDENEKTTTEEAIVSDTITTDNCNVEYYTAEEDNSEAIQNPGNTTLQYSDTNILEQYQLNAAPAKHKKSKKEKKHKRDKKDGIISNEDLKFGYDAEAVPRKSILKRNDEIDETLSQNSHHKHKKNKRRDE